MLSFAYVVLSQGRPHSFGRTLGEVREIITDLPDDDADSITVWRVFDSRSLQSGVEITDAFAEDWASRCEFGPGTEPERYLSAFPAFVRAHYGEQLMDQFEGAAGAIHAPMAKKMGERT